MQHPIFQQREKITFSHFSRLPNRHDALSSNRKIINSSKRWKTIWKKSVLKRVDRKSQEKNDENANEESFWLVKIVMATEENFHPANSRGPNGVLAENVVGKRRIRARIAFTSALIDQNNVDFHVLSLENEFCMENATTLRFVYTRFSPLGHVTFLRFSQRRTEIRKGWTTTKANPCRRLRAGENEENRGKFSKFLRFFPAFREGGMSWVAMRWELKMMKNHLLIAKHVRCGAATSGWSPSEHVRKAQQVDRRSLTVMCACGSINSWF